MSTSNPLYDYIVVGGGAAGIAGAYTLAEAGKNVLLVERGQSRDKQVLTQKLDGVGLVLNDVEGDSRGFHNAPVRLVKTTPSGVLSHTSSTLGGGSSVNMGILLHEDIPFWEDYAAQWNFPIDDMKTWKSAHEWVEEILASDVPPITPDGSGLYDQATNKSMLEFYSQDEDVGGPNSIIKPGTSWRGRTLFDYDEADAPRRTLDSLLVPDRIPPSLTVKTNTEVQSIFSLPNGTKCVKAIERMQGDPICPIVTYLPGLQWLFRCGRIETSDWISNEVQFCIDDSAQGGIVLAAGALSSPLILMRSGIGPESEVKHHPTPIYSEQIGRNLSDRFMSFASLYGYRVPPEERILTYAGLARLSYPTTTSDQTHQQGWKNDSRWKHLLFSESIIEDLEATPVINPYDPQAMEKRLKAWARKSTRHNIFAPWEDLGGGDMVVAVGMATRTFFPPSVRDDSNIVLFSKIQGHCLYKRWLKKNGIKSRGEFLGPVDISFLDQFVTNKVCDAFEPILDCYEHARAMFTLESNPISRGSISLEQQATNGSDRWNTSVEMPYLEEHEDRRVLIESVKHLWRSFSDIEEYELMTVPTDDTDRCPIPIMRAVFSFLVGGIVELDVMGYLKKALGLPETSLFDDLAKAWEKETLVGQGDHDDSKVNSPVIHNADMIADFLDGQEILAGQVSFSEEGIDHAMDMIWSSTHPSSRAISSTIPWMISERFRSQVAQLDLEDDCDIPFHLRYRSLPPLPCEITDDTAFSYILDYGMSLWHWIGSLRRSGDLAAPVAPNYEVRGAPGIYVIDASIYPHNPRMNPQVTVMAGGRFAAQTILGDQG